MIDEKLVAKFEGYVIAQLDNFQAKDVIEMVKDNYFPPIYEYDFPVLLSGIKQIIIDNREKILSLITYETIMKHGKEFRPDLLAIVQHPKGKAWLEGFLKIIKFTVKNIELSGRERSMLYRRRIQEIRARKQKVMEDELEKIRLEEESQNLEEKPMDQPIHDKNQDQKKPYSGFEDFVSDI